MNCKLIAKRILVFLVKFIFSLLLDYLILRSLHNLIDYCTDHGSPLRFFAPLVFLNLAIFFGTAIFLLVIGLLFSFGKAKKIFYVITAIAALCTGGWLFAFFSPCLVIQFPDTCVSSATYVYDAWKGSGNEEMVALDYDAAKVLYFEKGKKLRIPFWKSWHGKKVQELAVLVEVYSLDGYKTESLHELFSAKWGRPSNSCNINIPREKLPFFRMYVKINEDGNIESKKIKNHFWSKAR